MFGRGPPQVFWRWSPPLGVHPDGSDLDICPETSGKSQAAVARRQNQDPSAGQACTAPVRGCGQAAGHTGSPPGPGAAGAPAGPTSPEH